MAAKHIGSTTISIRDDVLDKLIQRIQHLLDALEGETELDDLLEALLIARLKKKEDC